MRVAIGLAAALWIGCGGSSAPVPPNDETPPEEERPEFPGPLEPVRDGRPSYPPVAPPSRLPVWQPGFHQALRWEVDIGRTTLRMKVPVGRAGSRLRFAFRAGDGDAVLHGATVAAAGAGGALASEPVAITFDGAPGFSAGPRERVLSDPIRFPVAFRDELYVTFEVEGHLAAGAIDLFPDSWADTGPAADAAVVAGWEEQRAIGLASILVRAPESRAIVALGDSITEAFVSGDDDYRRSWPQLAEARTGVPIANAGVSGQGMWAALRTLDEEVFVLPGITDCIVLLGTNDLGANDGGRICSDLGELFEELEPFCTVWAGTLVPKDRPDVTEEIREHRRQVNEWIRNEADVAGVIDFEAVLGDPADPGRWLPGLDEDGVHPSLEGQRLMGEAAARFIEQEILASGRD